VATRRIAVRRIPLTVFLFLLGLSAYVYLPVRAAQGPLLNWGNPTTLEKFLWHVTGKQYRVWMFNLEPAVLRANLVHFLRLVSDQYTPFLLWLPILGLLTARNKGPLVVAAAIFTFDLVYSLNYDIPDIDAYYIPAFMTMAMVSAFGLRFIFARAKRLSPVLLAVFVPLVPLTAHYFKCDMSRNTIAYDYADNYLRSVAPGGLCLTNNWDFYSPALYVQYVEGKRQDVILIDKELLRRSWYFDFLKRQYPTTYEMSAPETESYLEELDSFEHGKLQGSAEIQKRFIRMLNSLVSNQKTRGPAYTTFVNGRDVDAPLIGRGFRKVPWGMVYEFSTTGEHTPFDWSMLSLEGSFEANTYRDERTRSNLAVYPHMMLASGLGLLNEGEFEGAKPAFRRILHLDSENLTARLHLGGSHLMLGEYELAEESFRRVLAADPHNRMALEGLKAAQAQRTPSR
jgi:tetratricopeptide (TPR) repeat protein